jgi:hypothetical protein
MSMSRLRLLPALFTLCGTVSAPALAHHSQAMFDMEKCVTMQATVRTFEYNFPHSWLWVMVPGKGDAMDNWAFEAAAPAQMIEIDKRWARDVVKKGDKITIQFSPHKDGRNSGSLHSILLPNGSKILAATPACKHEADAVGGARPNG